MTTWTLTFRSTPNSVPEEIRMRRLLKAALRQFGFRCVSTAKAAEPPERLGHESSEALPVEADKLKADVAA